VFTRARAHVCRHRQLISRFWAIVCVSTAILSS
jgi:hypothetical protein